MPIFRFVKIPWGKVGLFLAALALALSGVFFNRGELAFAASLLVCYLFWDWTGAKEKNAQVPFSAATPRWRRVLAISLFAAAVVCVSAAVFLSDSLDTEFIAFAPWLAGIVLFALAGMVFDGVKLFGWLARFGAASPSERRSLFIDIALVVLIFQVALLLRMVNLESFPATVHGDEGEVGMEALRVLGVGDPLPPFGLGWAALPSMFFYLPAGTIALWGRNETGVRMASALFGVLGTPLAYWIGRKSWGRLAGIASAWLMAISHFNIHFSRLGVNCIESAFFMLLFVLLFFVSQPEQERTDGRMMPYIAIGLTMGLAQYVGVYSRLIPILALLLYAVQFARKRVSLAQIAAMAITAFAVFAPLGLFYFRHPIDFNGRVQTVSIFNQENLEAAYGEGTTIANSLPRVLKNQIRENVNFYLQSGDRSSFYDGNLPAFDFITATLFWLGLGVLFSRAWRLPEMTLIAWVVLGTLLGGVFTNSAPSGTRLLITTSVVFLIGGVFIQRVWDALSGFFRQSPAPRLLRPGVWAAALVVVGLAALGVNLNIYFRIYPRSAVNAVPIFIAKEIVSVTPENHVYLFGDGNLYANHGVIRFLVGLDAAVDVNNIDQIPAPAADGKGAAVLITFSNFDEIDGLRALYPQGSDFRKYYFGRLLFIEYRIPPLGSE